MNKATEQCSLLKLLAQAKLTRGKKEQLGTWDVTLNEVSSQAIFLQPPAALVFTLPTSAAGELSTAIALHPETWDKPQAGPCEFYLRVDGRLALVMAIDPVNVPSDRCWHQIKLNIPQSPSGSHQVTFETRALGQSTDFRWALWRAPRFVWQKTATDIPVDSPFELAPAGQPQGNQ